MSTRELFVFAGQSNMMGAAVLPVQVAISAADCYEYKHKPRRMGEARGRFVSAGYPCHVTERNCRLRGVNLGKLVLAGVSGTGCTVVLID